MLSKSVSSRSAVATEAHHVLTHLALPGRIVIERGTFADYRRLRHFHYAPGDPRVPVGVWRARYEAARAAKCDLSPAPLAAVAVLSYPTLSSRARERAMGLLSLDVRERIGFVNAHVRTIARVIVHPQFRGLGLASLLVRRACRGSPTRYVEAFAAMGDLHPMFERGGMRRTNADEEREDAYFLFERTSRLSRSRRGRSRTL